MILRVAAGLVVLASAAGASTIRQSYDLRLTPVGIAIGQGSNQITVQDIDDLPIIVSREDCFVDFDGPGATCNLPAGTGLVEAGRTLGADLVLTSNLGTNFVVQPLTATVSYAPGAEIRCSDNLAALFRFCGRPSVLDPFSPDGITIEADIGPGDRDFSFRFLQSQFLFQELSPDIAQIAEDSLSRVTIGDFFFDGSDGFGLSYTVEVIPAPIPLPAALPMLAAGLGLLGLYRRNRKTAATPGNV